MKLKQAIKIAKKKGYNWGAVDKDDEICMYDTKPFINIPENMWDTRGECKLIAGYTGSKHWTKTRRKVKCQ